jgi:hypothetical protein
LTRLTVSSADPASTPAVGYVPVTIYGRNIVAGAIDARLVRDTPSPSPWR